MAGAPWRLLCDPPGSAAWNMAVDDALLEHCERGPTLRLYTWERPSVSLGYRQATPAWRARADALGIDCVRRVTGGGTVLHGRDLTYAVVAPRDAPGLPPDVRGSYLWVRERWIEALRAVGADARPSAPSTLGDRAELCFAGATGLEIDVAGRKRVGSAQRRTRWGFLQHGSVPLEDDAERAAELFGQAWPRLSGGPLVAADLRTAVIAAFERALGAPLMAGDLEAAERQRAQAGAVARRLHPTALPALSLRTARALADTPA